MTQPALFQTPRTDWTTPLPQWLANNIDTLNNRERQEDQVELIPCPRCATPIFRAFDITTWRIDPTSLTNQLELAALILRRQTFTLSIDTFKHLGIAYRGPRDIQDQPASVSEAFSFPGRRGRKQLFVLPEHQCHRRLGQPIPWTTLYTEPEETAPNAPAPF